MTVSMSTSAGVIFLASAGPSVGPPVACDPDPLADVVGLGAALGIEPDEAFWGGQTRRPAITPAPITTVKATTVASAVKRRGPGRGARVPRRGPPLRGGTVPCDPTPCEPGWGGPQNAGGAGRAPASSPSGSSVQPASLPYALIGTTPSFGWVPSSLSASPGRCPGPKGHLAPSLWTGLRRATMMVCRCQVWTRPAQRTSASQGWC
jgi:hypothetical protein